MSAELTKQMLVDLKKQTYLLALAMRAVGCLLALGCKALLIACHCGWQRTVLIIMLQLKEQEEARAVLITVEPASDGPAAPPQAASTQMHWWQLPFAAMTAKRTSDDAAELSKSAFGLPSYRQGSQHAYESVLLPMYIHLI